MSHAARRGSLVSRRQTLKSLAGAVVVPLLFGRSGRAQQAGDAAADVQVQPPPARIRVVSANVRYGSADDGENRWDRRRELLARVLREQRADLIGTQEMLPFQAEYLGEQLEGFTYVGRSRDLDDAQGEQCGIFFRADRFVQLAAGHFWLSRQPDVPGSRDWDAALPRMATWIKLYDRSAHRPLMIVNTHFDHRGDVARLRSAEVVREFVSRHADRYPIAVTGDFNTGENSEPYRELVPAANDAHSPLRDVYRLVHPERQPEEGTFNGFEGRRSGPRIDWILASDSLRPLAASIVTANDQGQYPSDHFPVFAELEFVRDNA
jgi:endonuclease/exonuclease/phosphatase family metal-dependent hydrolase